MPITAHNTEPPSSEHAARASAPVFAFPPAGLPPQPAEPLFSPALCTAGRVLAAFTGLAVGAAMLVGGGLYALVTTCVDYYSEANVCGSLQGLVAPLELVAVLGGTAAAVAGGVGTAVTSRARWIAAGLAITFVLVLALTVLGDMQQPALNWSSPGRPAGSM